MNLNDLYLVRDALDTALTGGGNDTDLVDALQLIENAIQESNTVGSVPEGDAGGYEDNEVSDTSDGRETDVVAEVADSAPSQAYVS